MPESKKRSLKSVTLTVKSLDGHWHGMVSCKQHGDSKKQSDSGVLWCPVSHGVSAKWSFGYLGQVKIAGKFFEG